MLRHYGDDDEYDDDDDLVIDVFLRCLRPLSNPPTPTPPPGLPWQCRRL